MPADTLLPLWTALPFCALLLAIASVPLLSAAWWHRHYPKACLALGAPTVAMLLLRGGEWPGRYVHVLQEYVSFIVLLGALFTIAGGVLLRGHLVGTPFANTALLATGTVLASFVGTTGASMLLIRTVLQANRRRKRSTHVVVFFIFLVSNIGGCLTPLGDPPLFLGYLQGVPFAWTLNLAGAWAGVSGALLALFFLIDYALYRGEKGAQADEAEGLRDPLDLDGWVNLALLGGIVGIILLSGRGHWPWGVQEGAMLALAALSWKSTPRRVREANAFSFAPMQEVAILFAGIFATMAPALILLESAPSRWPAVRITEPWQFFWATGALSGVLDNAPTYLSFAVLAKGVLGVTGDGLGGLLAAPGGEGLLKAISLGAVFMGAMTYIGNGPNFMVKAIAERSGMAMPSFTGYLKWSVGILVPVFLVAGAAMF